MPGELLLQPEELHANEAVLVRDVFGIEDLDVMHPQDRQEYDHLVGIVVQFSRIHPETGRTQMISKGRIAAIPAITERHVNLLLNARGSLSYDDIRKSWRDNMPENDGTREPDLLFDIAQFNFGSDEPIGDVVRALTVADQQRRAMRVSIKQHITRLATQYRYHRDLADDTDDEEIDEMVDAMSDELVSGRFL